MLRKKLNFDFNDACDLAYHEDIEDDYEDQEDEIEISTKKRRIFRRHDNSESSLELTPNTTYSPCRTRSGRIFNNSANSSMEEKPPKKMMHRQKAQEVKVFRLQEPRLPTPVFNPMSNQPNKDRLPTPVFNPLSNQPGKELHLLKKDLPGPPPLNYVRRPRSR